MREFLFHKGLRSWRRARLDPPPVTCEASALSAELHPYAATATWRTLCASFYARQS